MTAINKIYRIKIFKLEGVGPHTKWAFVSEMLA